MLFFAAGSLAVRQQREALMAGASGLMASSASNDWLDHLYQAKYGRSFPTEQANTAYREEVTPKAALPDTWFEDFWRAKYGRSFPNK